MEQPRPAPSTKSVSTPPATNRASGTAMPKRQRTSDPVVRWLGIILFAIVALALAAVFSAAVFGLLDTTGAPRTQVERDLTFYGEKIQTGKVNSATTAAYVDALIRAGQLAKATDTLERALQVAKSDKSYLIAEQAKIDFTSKRYDDASASATKAMKEAEKELQAFKKRNVAAGRVESAGAVMPQSYSTAALVKADALVALNNYADAIKAYDAYLKIAPTDSDVLVMRAQAKTSVGDTKGAEKDYRQALKFIPDYQPALDGLKQIGASK